MADLCRWLCGSWSQVLIPRVRCCPALGPSYRWLWNHLRCYYMLLLTMSQAPFLTIPCLPALRSTASLSFNQYDLGSGGLRESVPTPRYFICPQHLGDRCAAVDQECGGSCAPRPHTLWCVESSREPTLLCEQTSASTRGAALPHRATLGDHSALLCQSPPPPHVENTACFSLPPETVTGMQ